ncbi:MAG: DeoR/GlpR family DNA-binding transcription regulator [Bacteroidales bacterium]
MLNDRQKKILDHLGSGKEGSVNGLSDQLGVSGVTIRQDLRFLEGQGLLKRVHGGAVLRDADDLENRLGIRFEQKLRIARRLARDVQDGETILVESGSVNVLLARELAERKVNLITTNAYIARQFRKNPGASILLLGGLYQPDSESMVGRMTRFCIGDQINIDKAFIGIDGFSPEAGFTSRDMLRAEVSAYIIEKARDSTIVSDSSKFGKVELTRICGVDDVQHVATNKDLDPLVRKHLKETGVDLILA